MKFMIYCDFATLKCTREEFTKKLKTFCNYYDRHNDYVWEIEVDKIELLQYSDNTCETIYLQFSSFIDSSSFLKICKVSESFGNDAP